MAEELRQLKLIKEGELGEKGNGKRRVEKGNKWILVLILIVTIIVSLMFSWSGGWRKSKPVEVISPTGDEDGLFGQKVYQF